MTNKRWVQVRATPQLRDDLETVSGRQGISMSEVVRRAVREYRLRLQRAEARRVARAQ